MDLTQHLYRLRAFSKGNFGPDPRTAGIIDHIKKELVEIENNPDDLEEWIDLAILAFDGAWRRGFSPEDIVSMLLRKQEINESRTWPNWRDVPADKAIEHIPNHPLIDPESWALEDFKDPWPDHILDDDYPCNWAGN